MVELIKRAHGKKVLVVDDDLSILDVIKTILEDSGYLVQLAENASDLEKLLEETFPDLILIDFWLPGASGQEIALRLKENNKTSKIPIIMISAHNFGKQIAAECGVDDFLAKPFDINDLLLMVGKYTKVFD